MTRSRPNPRRAQLCAAALLPALLALPWLPASRAAGPAPAAPPAPTALAIDGGHSSVIFRIKHMETAFFYGRFDGIAGTITLDESEGGASSVEFTIDTGSVHSGNAKRDQHILSPDFLSAEEFPQASFASTRVVPAGEDRWTVEGQLTLRGVSRPLSISVERTGRGESRGTALQGFETRFTILRSEFGNDFMIGPLSDAVDLIVSVEARQS